MNALTTLKLTSASSSASRISRSAVSTCSGVSRTSPRSDLKTSWMRVLSDSNMEDGGLWRYTHLAQTLILGELVGLWQVPAGGSAAPTPPYVGRNAPYSMPNAS